MKSIITCILTSLPFLLTLLLLPIQGAPNHNAPLPVPSLASALPYTLGIRDSIMIAHSFHDHPSFGPAGKMHGATYTCDVEFVAAKLQKTVNWVLDIGYASELLSEVLSQYNMKNLDEVFGNGEFTTTEFMARRIQMDLAKRLRECVDGVEEEVEDGEENCNGPVFEGIIRVKLYESHKAWASFEGPV
jgi:6-pyruvoyl-tetrahydropterin synthase